MKEELARVKKETAAKIYLRIGLVGLLAVMTISLFSGYGYYVSLFGHPVVFRLLALSLTNFWVLLYTLACAGLLITGIVLHIQLHRRQRSAEKTNES